MSAEVQERQYSEFALANQRVNEATFGVANLANVQTGTGLALAWSGSSELDTWEGILKVGAAFTLDVTDGITARRLGVTGKFGAAFDAIADKIKVAKGAYHVWKDDLAPKSLLVAVGLQNAANIGITVIDKVINEDSDLEVTRNGKRAMAFQVGGVGANVIGNKVAEERPVLGAGLKIGGTVLGFYGFAKYGIPATTEYWNTMKNGKRRSISKMADKLIDKVVGVDEPPEYCLSLSSSSSAYNHLGQTATEQKVRKMGPIQAPTMREYTRIQRERQE